MTTCVTLLSGMTLGPGRRYHLSPANGTGEMWRLVDPAADRDVARLVVGPQRGSAQPRRAWGYLPKPAPARGWQHVPGACGEGVCALGDAVAGLLAALAAQ